MIAFLKLAAFQASLYWLTLVKANEGTCPSGWTFVEKANRCYKYLATPVSWDVALRKCNRQNATLPTIHDQETNDAIGAFNARRYYAFYHIGLRHAAASEWQWTDGSPVDYANWKGDYTPNNRERCAAARVDERGVAGWFALDCDYTEWPTICERPTSKRNGGNGGHSGTTEQSTGTEASAATSTTADATTITEQVITTATIDGTNEVKEACKDKASAWKCKSLSAINACKAGAYFKYLEENCARSCGFCN